MNFSRLACLAVALHLLALGAWGTVRPIARNERAAEETWRRALRHHAKGDHRGAYLLFRNVGEEYPLSRYGERGRYRAARTALYDLGRFDLAREEFQNLLDRGIEDVDIRSTVERELRLLDAAQESPESSRWEFFQARSEEERGLLARARLRYEWILRNHEGSSLAKEAEQRLKEMETLRGGGE